MRYLRRDANIKTFGDWLNYLGTVKNRHGKEFAVKFVSSSKERFSLTKEEYKIGMRVAKENHEHR